MQTRLQPTHWWASAVFAALVLLSSGDGRAASARFYPVAYPGAEAGVNVPALVVPTATTLVAIVYGQGILRTTDGGTTWSVANTGLPSRNANFITRTVEASPVLFVGLDGAGLFRSTDNGATWTTSNGSGGTALTCTYANAMGIADAFPSTVYLGTSCGSTTSGGVWKSTDKGLSWTFVSGGVSGMPGGLTINDIIVDPANASIVYAGTTGGVYKSIDGGTSWALANNGITTPWATLTISNLSGHPVTSGDLVAQATDGGVFRTTDGGANWTDISAGLPATDFISGMVHDRADPSIIWAGLGNLGIYKGTVSGVNVSWTLVSAAVPAARAVGSSNADPTRLYARSYNGLWTSTNGGTSWTQLLPSSNPGSVPVAPAVVARASTASDSFFTTSDSLYRDSDHSRRLIAGVTLRSGQADQIAIDAVTPTTMYVATLSDGIFKSTNGGTSFAPVNSGLPADLRRSDAIVVADPVTADLLYAGFFGGFGYGMYKSTNGGTTWTPINNGLATNAPDSQRVRHILIDPTNHSLIYILTNDGMYKATDAGATWTKPTTSFTGQNRHLAFKSGDTTTLYLGRSSFNADGTATSGSGVWRSTNGGANWTQLLSSEPVFRVGTPPTGGNTSTIYAGVSFTNNNSGGLFRSIDGGGTWSNYNRGNPADNIRCISTYVSDPTWLSVCNNSYGEYYHLSTLSGADFKNDAFNDVVWRNSSGVNAIWDYTTSAVGGYTTTFPGGVDASWAIKGVGDLTGDLKSDVVWFQQSTGLVAVWRMSSAATIAGVAFPAAVGAASPWQILGVGDIYGAGKASIIWRHSTTGQVLEWYLNSNGSLAGSRSYPTLSTQWQFRGLADTDGDGIKDIVWFRASDGQVAIWRLKGGSVQSTQFPFAVGGASGWDIYKTGDFDGDGIDDLFWRNTNGWTVVTYMGVSGTVGSKFMPSVPLAQWRVDAVGDFDNSGSEDLLWYDTVNGNVLRWLMPNDRVSGPTAQSVVGIGAGWHAYQ